MSYRAYTHPISNAVVLPQFSLGEGLDTVAHMQLPKRCVPQFLHEIMHQWCFDSPVGFALTLLQMRANRTALSGIFADKVDDDSRYAIAQDICRIRCFLEFMRPILEGMALFAEHDLTLGTSKIISRPAMLSGLMFAGRQENPHDYLLLTPAIISSARLTPAHVRRKANLLLQPFGNSSDGYLAGYLFMRLFYRIAINRHEAFVDADFFVHALRNWLFEDWDLVSLLLSTTDYEQWAEEMVLYCQKRIIAFRTLSPGDFTDFERRSESGECDTFEYRSPFFSMTMNSHPIVWNDTPGKDQLRKLMDDMFLEEPLSPLLKSVFQADITLLTLRSTVTLGHSEFDAKVTSGGMLQLFSDSLQLFSNGVPFPVFATGAPEKLPSGWSEKVLVELILTVNPPGIYQFISTKDGVVIPASFRRDGMIPDFLQTQLLNWEKRHELLTIQDTATTIALKDSVEQSLIDLTLKRVRRTRKDVFELKGLSLTPDDLIETAQRLLSDDGILPILDASADLVLDAAAISICASLMVQPEISLPTWKWSRGTPFATAEHINNCFEKSLRFKPFIFHESDVIFSMI